MRAVDGNVTTVRLNLRRFTLADVDARQPGRRYVRTLFADWPDPLPGGEPGDVEYALTRAERIPATSRSRRSDH
jgi:hypothetical protein